MLGLRCGNPVVFAGGSLLALALGCGAGEERAPPRGYVEPRPGSSGGSAGFGIAARPVNTACRLPSRPTAQAGDTFPRTLSATGCVDPSRPAEPAVGLIPYDVNSPLFSDGTEKARFFALPEGGLIHVRADGDLDFPAGSVLMKRFDLGTAHVETRLLVRHDDGQWAGYSYAWRPDGTDADLLETTLVRSFGELEWVYPSRENCLECHTEAAGRSLGLELGQLNRVVSYANGPFSQLATFEHIGLFDSRLPEAPPALPAPAAAGPVESRARSYLHANCANCHRPNAVEEATIDLRFDTPFAETRLCDVEPGKGSFGLRGAKLVKPGDPALSILSLRMHSQIADVRMPPIGRTLPDISGIDLVDGWVRSLTACP